MNRRLDFDVKPSQQWYTFSTLQPVTQNVVTGRFTYLWRRDPFSDLVEFLQVKWLRWRNYPNEVWRCLCVKNRHLTYLRCAIHNLLRPYSSAAMDVPATRRPTKCYRAFAVAAARTFNLLPPDITDATSLPVFKRCLKTFLLAQSYPTWYRLFSNLGTFIWHGITNITV